ncbi:glucoamylase family protein [Natronogracilivirga saccharolytica]|uniref:Beta-glucosidase n=1 Tax=Natronogracilivirga saccharolytica TaxID=2812953 RepID=A0A8J7UWJ8_9BACT|nr:glucoamylase family protein [Natronogracilivirga saccharolytica]MBP3192309.1 beta-glucosidase [Natronogracilivirga saccharolytica]
MRNFTFFSAAALAAAFFLTPGCNHADTDSSVNTDRLSDEALLDTVQYYTFQYFWDGAEPQSGMARERYWLDEEYPHDNGNTVTSGGSGFGLKAIITGIERGFITREEGVDRFERIVGFLEEAERFNGLWAHWMDGTTGEALAFSPEDDGADIVETSFLIQGLLTVRQYLRDGTEREQQIAERIDTMWREVNWNWHTREGEENILYWHWSPNHGWAMDHPIAGYDECLVTYILAASSPTYPIDPEVYHEGWARGGDIVAEGLEAYGYSLPLQHNRGEQYGGPLFWAHYSYLGLDPRNLEDRYANYWDNNRYHSLIQYEYAKDNPFDFKGYGEDLWGLTSSYNPDGYVAHTPHYDDHGVITPTAALSSIPYTPEESMKVMRNLYENFYDETFGPYGFYDALSLEHDWFPQRYLAIDQGPIVVMIENHRSGLLWDLFMSSEEVQEGLERLEFSY